MNVLGVIPARGGSKAVPRKNIRLLGGQPLIYHTIQASSQSKLLSRTIVSTDDDEIARIAEKYAAEVPFMRPSQLATDSAGALETMQHALETMELIDGENKYDALMMLQPTTPFRRTSDIDGAIQLLESTDADSVISVVEVEGHHPARMKFLEQDRLIDPPFCEERENQPREELQSMYIRNGAIYLTRRDVLLNNSFKGQDCRAWIMPVHLSINIDTEFNFRYAEWLIQEKLV